MLHKRLLHKRKQYQFYKKLINKNDLCFDVGANIGNKTTIFSKIGAKVHAFEPQKSCIPSLKKLQERYPKIDIHPYGVGNKNETQNLHLANYSEIATFSTKFIEEHSSNNVFWKEQQSEVPIKSFTDIIEKLGVPDFCKIDVEGYEALILTSNITPIPLIEFECTGAFLEEGIQIIKHLSSLGEICANFNKSENPYFEQKEWLSKDAMIAYLKSNIGKKIHLNIFVKTA